MGNILCREGKREMSILSSGLTPEEKEKLYHDFKLRASPHWETGPCSTNDYGIGITKILPGATSRYNHGESQTSFADTPTAKDEVNKPPHYTYGKIEVIDAIEDWKLGFHEGNVVKYVARAKHKGNEIKDLKKAKWYLERAIERIENNKKECAACSYLEHVEPTSPAYAQCAQHSSAALDVDSSKLINELIRMGASCRPVQEKLEDKSDADSQCSTCHAERCGARDAYGVPVYCSKHSRGKPSMMHSEKSASI
jgi:hypothetical protein